MVGQHLLNGQKLAECLIMPMFLYRHLICMDFVTIQFQCMPSHVDGGTAGGMLQTRSRGWETLHRVLVQTSHMHGFCNHSISVHVDAFPSGWGDCWGNALDQIGLDIVILQISFTQSIGFDYVTIQFQCMSIESIFNLFPIVKFLTMS